MASKSVLLINMLLPLAVYASPAAQITPAPLVERQDYSLRFIGWGTSGNTYIPWTCATSSTWTTSGTYGGCCMTNSVCQFITTCLGNWAYYGSTSVSCASSAPCATFPVYSSMGAKNPTLNLACNANSARDLFVQEPTITSGSVSTTGSVTSTQSSTSNSASTSNPTSTAASSTSNNPSAASATTTATQTAQPSSSKSKAWIAGAVIGPLGAIAIIGGLLFWIFRLKRRNKDPSSTNPNAPPPAGGYVPPHQGEQYYQPPMAQQQWQQPQGGYSPAQTSPAPAYSSEFGQQAGGYYKQPQVGGQQGVPHSPPGGQTQPHELGAQPHYGAPQQGAAELGTGH